MNTCSKLFFLSLGIPLILLPVESSTSYQEQLTDAVEAENVTRVKLLLDKGVSPNFSYSLKKYKVTPFQHDIFKHSHTTKELTPLISAILAVNKELFDLLLRNGVHVQSRKNPPMEWVLHGISAFRHPRVANSFSSPFTEWYEIQRLVHIRRYMAIQLLVRGDPLWLPRNEGERHFLLEAAYQADRKTGTTTFEKRIPSRKRLLERGRSVLGDALAVAREWTDDLSHQLAISSQDVTHKEL